MAVKRLWWSGGVAVDVERLLLVERVPQSGPNLEHVRLVFDTGQEICVGAENGKAIMEVLRSKPQAQ